VVALVEISGVGFYQVVQKDIVDAVTFAWNPHQTEEQLTEHKVPYEVGLARYAELAKGQMLGDDQGLLKLIFCPNSLKLLGVHVIGDRAAEIVHIGQVVLSLGASIEYFRDAVFNYPTLAEAYKVAALDGLNKL
jgi:NAD(P) transhydrogenase